MSDDWVVRERMAGMSPADKRAMTHCVHGHEFTETNTYWTPTGQRRCRICARRRMRELYERREDQGLTARGTPRIYRRWKWMPSTLLDEPLRSRCQAQ